MCQTPSVLSEMCHNATTVLTTNPTVKVLTTFIHVAKYVVVGLLVIFIMLILLYLIRSIRKPPTSPNTTTPLLHSYTSYEARLNLTSSPSTPPPLLRTEEPLDMEEREDQPPSYAELSLDYASPPSYDQI